MSSPSLVSVKLSQPSGRPFSRHNVFFSSFYVNKIYFGEVSLRLVFVVPVTDIANSRLDCVNLGKTK
jgi:hypothetical protein